MSSIEALARLQRVAGKTGKALPLLSATAREARLLARQPTRPGFDLPPDLIERLHNRLRQTQWIYSFRRLKRVEWRLAPLLLWQGEPPLITVFGMFDRVISRLEDDRTGVMARRLIQAWLAAYDDDMPKRDAAAAHLTPRHAGFMAALRRHTQALIGTEELRSEGLPPDQFDPMPDSPGN